MWILKKVRFHCHYGLSRVNAHAVRQVKEVFSVLNEIQMQLDTVQVELIWERSISCGATWKYMDKRSHPGVDRIWVFKTNPHLNVSIVENSMFYSKMIRKRENSRLHPRDPHGPVMVDLWPRDPGICGGHVGLYSGDIMINGGWPWDLQLESGETTFGQMIGDIVGIYGI